MKIITRDLLYGVLIWVITFAAGMVFFPFHESNRPLFESLIAVVLALATSLVSVMHFKRISKNYLQEGVKAGLLWLLINIVIDLPLFMQGPMEMSPGAYLSDIGASYLMIPAIVISFGYLLEQKAKNYENK